MKRPAFVSIVVMTLVAGAVNASVASAKPAAGKPVSMTQYFHGTERLGELQKPVITGNYATMDAKAPTGSDARSSGATNYVGGPNTKCAGNSLFPVWVGAVDGAPTGDVTVELFLQTAGSGSIEVRLFGDVQAQACNDNYPNPIGSETVALTTGQTKATVTLKNINPKGKPVKSLMVQVTPVLGAPYLARVQYDSAAANSRITFSCQPLASKQAC